MFQNLALSTVMVVLTTAVHFSGLAMSLRVMQRQSSRFDRLQRHAPMQFLMMGGIVLSLFALHSVEIWMYAGVYMALGEFPTWEAALYFSTSTFTTVGFGDVFLDERWRVLSAIESANGFILIGWSTAFLVSVTARIRVLEAMGSHAARHEERG